MANIELKSIIVEEKEHKDNYSMASTNPTKTSTVLPALTSLTFLDDFEEFYISTNSNYNHFHDFVAIIRCKTGNTLLSVDLKPRGLIGLIQEINTGRSTMHFLSSTGQIMFISDREELISTVTAGEYALGMISFAPLIWNPKFKILNRAGGPNFKLAQDRASTCLSRSGFLKYYWIKDHQVYEEGGDRVATIFMHHRNVDEDERNHRVVFIPGVDAKSKGLVLSTVLMLDELYFSNQFGIPRIGVMGWMLYLLLIIVVTFFVKKVFFS